MSAICYTNTLIANSLTSAIRQVDEHPCLPSADGEENKPKRASDAKAASERVTRTHTVTSCISSVSGSRLVSRQLPEKAAVGPEYGALDDRLMSAIHIRFGLPAALPKSVKQQIKRADKVSAWMEATQIAGFSEAEASKFFGRPNPDLMEGLSIVLRPPVDTRNDFTARHLDLLGAL